MSAKKVVVAWIAAWRPGRIGPVGRCMPVARTPTKPAAHTHAFSALRFGIHHVKSLDAAWKSASGRRGARRVARHDQSQRRALRPAQRLGDPVQHVIDHFIAVALVEQFVPCLRVNSQLQALAAGRA